jgi:archaellum component FlaC
MKNVYNKIKTNEIELINDLYIESIINNDFNLLRDGISFFINTINDLKKKLEKSENYIKKLESDKVLIKNNIKNIRIVSQKLLSDIKES